MLKFLLIAKFRVKRLHRFKTFKMKKLVRYILNSNKKLLLWTPFKSAETKTFIPCWDNQQPGLSTHSLFHEEERYLEDLLEVDESIKFDVVKKNRKNTYFQLYNFINETTTFISKKQAAKEGVFFVLHSLFLCIYLFSTQLHFILRYIANHRTFLNKFTKDFVDYLNLIYTLDLKFDCLIVFKRLNYTALWFQKKKFGSIKKSRKKLMYMFLPIL